MMRIIGGTLKSRRLKFPKTPLIRPATDRRKQVIFDILGQGLQGQVVLDLYAGMGSLGIEALSRGASEVTFVDQSPLAIRYIRMNLKELGLMERAQILMEDVNEAVSRLKKQGQKYDLVFIDPPYNKALVKKTLLQVERFDILQNLGRIVIEHTRQEEPCPLNQLKRERVKQYGVTCLSFLYKTGYE